MSEGYAARVDAVRALALSAEAAEAEADAMLDGRLEGDYAAINDAIDRADAAREALVAELVDAEREGLTRALSVLADEVFRMAPLWMTQP